MEGETTQMIRISPGLITMMLMLASFAYPQANIITPQTVEEALHQISNQADVIFAGHVIAIRPHNKEAVTSGYIQIDFGVDQGIRGCVSGETYTLREWAGLWAGNPDRYQVGRRLLMMLRAPGASGMSSPVGGMDGAIPIRGGGAPSLLSGPSTLSQISVVDLRWIGAKLLHPMSYMLQTPLQPTPLGLSQQALPRTKNLIADLIITTESDSSGRASTPVHQASVDTVVRLLTSWQKASHDGLR